MSKPALAILLALSALALPARADIYLRDDGQAVSLTNNPVGEGYERVAADARPAAAPAKPAASSLPAGKPAAYAPLVAAAAAEHGLPESLLHAVIRVESNYNPNAVSPKGAVGLMQLMPETARRMGVADARDPAANIAGGARYLKELLAQFGNDVPIALAAYNAGPGAVTRSGRAIPRIAETRQYVPRVLAHYQRLQAAN